MGGRQGSDLIEPLDEIELAELAEIALLLGMKKYAQEFIDLAYDRANGVAILDPRERLSEIRLAARIAGDVLRLSDRQQRLISAGDV